MKKKVLTSVILFGLLVSNVTLFQPVYAARMTRKQKKEASYINTAQASFNSKQYDLAIEYYTKAIGLNPENADSYAKRGNARFLSGDYKNAVIDYTKALELDPTRENIYYNRGIAKANLNAYEEVL